MEVCIWSINIFCFAAK